MEIALIPMSAKPYQAGHHNLVLRAAAECDSVVVYVSTSDRAMPGQFPVFGADMVTIWNRYLMNIMPNNVDAQLIQGSPVQRVYKHLGEAKDAESSDVFYIFGGGDDGDNDDELGKKFADHLLEKYFPEMMAAGQIRFRRVSRSETGGVSGTQMRKYLQVGDIDSFMNNLPDDLDDAARGQIWGILINGGSKEPLKRGKKAQPVGKEKVQELIQRLLDSDLL